MNDFAEFIDTFATGDELVIAKHIHAHTTTLPSGHVPVLSRPKEVAAVIIDAANHAGTTVTANKAATR